MKLKTLALGAVLALAAVAPAAAQRGGNWEQLGEERVGIGAESTVISINRGEDYYRDRAYRRLRVRSEGGEVKLKAVRLVYLNGHAEDLQFNQNIGSGREVDVDLRGERSYLRQVELFYKGKFGISIGGGGLRVGTPILKVFAENARFAPPPGPVPPSPGHGGDWFTAGAQSFDRQDGQVVVRIGRREGRIGQIRLQHRGEPVTLRGITIRYGNGETQNVRIAQELRDGDQTQRIDLEGERRILESVSISFEPRRRPGPAEITVLGTERPGREGGDRPGAGSGYRPNSEWQLLGQQSVGFGVDRDVIRVNQSEDWYRNRAFGRLHFVAEGNEIHMMAVRVVYMNGYGEDYRVDRLLRPGEEYAIDLAGRRSYIREIETVYRARPGFGGRAALSVYGENYGRR